MPPTTSIRPDIFSRETKTETLQVKSVLQLASLAISGDNFKATYHDARVLPDGTELTALTYSVDRSIAAADQAVSDWLVQGMVFAEAWRQEDLDNRAATIAAAEAEAIRWAGLTLAEQQAEFEAIRKAPTP